MLMNIILMYNMFYCRIGRCILWYYECRHIEGINRVKESNITFVHLYLYLNVFPASVFQIFVIETRYCFAFLKCNEVLYDNMTMSNFSIWILQYLFLQMLLSKFTSTLCFQSQGFVIWHQPIEYAKTKKKIKCIN